jgi:hypothetical protein
MKKQIICVLVAILIVSIKNNTAAQKIKLLKKTHLADYPSASSLEFYKDRLYVIGDDAASILILDKEHQFIDSIPVFTSTGKRIDKATKADLESSSIITLNEKDYLVVFSSFSTSNRNKIIFIDLSANKSAPKIVEGRIEKIGVEELNIEGATSINGNLVLSNRANTTHKNNSLIISTIDTVMNIGQNHKIITLVLPETKNIIGISGLYYLQEKDMLLFTASTEDTPNAYTDGTIGASYIGYIKNASKKLDTDVIQVDKLIPVSSYLTEKTAQKIESITVEKIRKRKGIIHLAADNDNGESTLFKLKVKL